MAARLALRFSSMLILPLSNLTTRLQHRIQYARRRWICAGGRYCGAVVANGESIQTDEVPSQLIGGRPRDIGLIAEIFVHIRISIGYTPDKEQVASVEEIGVHGIRAGRRSTPDDAEIVASRGRGYPGRAIEADYPHLECVIGSRAWTWVERSIAARHGKVLEAPLGHRYCRGVVLQYSLSSRITAHNGGACGGSSGRYTRGRTGG